MSQSFSVNLAGFDGAKGAVDRAAAHYGGLAEPDLRLQAESLRDLRAFEGGHGVTGHFQAALAAFGTEWMKMFGAFIEDERNFATFLRGFAERLTDTHEVYQENELRAAARFEAIGRTLGQAGDR